MCIIAAKPAGVKMPDSDTIRTMWYANHDGAGFMYAADGKVKIEKGFMTLSAFETALAKAMSRYDFDSLAVVLHFRITTHGGTCPANCHPFPLTRSVKSLQALTSYAAIGVAHNGIIPIRPRFGISDTMEYIASQLAPLASALPEFYTSPAALELIENAIQSKMVFLTDSGKLTTVGEFITDGGILYSNPSYRGYRRTFSSTPAPKRSGSSKSAHKSGKSKAKSKTPAKKPLQWALSLPDGTYAMDFDGNELIEDVTDLLIDEDGKTYVFDCLADAARPASDIRLYNAEGFAAHFEPDMADLERIIDDETDMPFRF